MQPLSWYLRRIRGMSAGEIAWRVKGVVRDKADRLRFKVDAFTPAEMPSDFRNVKPAFRVSQINVGAWADPKGIEATWRDALAAQAEEILAHRLSFFNLRNVNVGHPIDWNRDHSAKKVAPLKFAADIDYRDFSETGDCKLVWEPNRHHHLVVLARAYRATGRPEFAQEVVSQLESWFDQCPFGVGMNWRSPLEFGIRLINDVWAIDLIQESGLVTGAFRDRFLQSIYSHIWSIQRSYSRGSSANNHTVGEAAGVYIASAYFLNLGKRDQWMREAREILIQQLFEQTSEDGGSREQAFGYHLFVLWLFLLSAYVGKLVGDNYPDEYWHRLEKMMEFAGVLSFAGGMPRYGDCDDAYVLDLGATHGDVTGLLCLGAILFDRADFKMYAGEFRESSSWLLGEAGAKIFQSVSDDQLKKLESRAFQQTGLYLLQSGCAGNRDAISILFDCAELGFRSIAAHGHADSLSFTLHAFGDEILVDPGTYDYFTYPEWRNHFRSTAAHNTIEIDGKDQSEMLGPFLWGDSARSRCLEWAPNVNGGKVAGEHDGYSRFGESIIHSRSIDLDAEERVITIRDEVIASSTHSAAISFHVGPRCNVREDGNSRVLLEASHGTAVLEFDHELKPEIVCANENSKLGWVSRGYHSKQPSNTIVLRGRFTERKKWTTRIVLSRPR